MYGRGRVKRAAGDDGLGGSMRATPCHSVKLVVGTNDIRKCHGCVPTVPQCCLWPRRGRALCYGSGRTATAHHKGRELAWEIPLARLSNRANVCIEMRTRLSLSVAFFPPM